MIKHGVDLEEQVPILGVFLLFFRPAEKSLDMCAEGPLFEKECA